MLNFTRFQIVLAVILIISGCINTISVKWTDTIKAEGADGQIRSFSHPFIQCDILFVGDIYCLIIFKIIYIVLSRRQDGSVEENPITKGSRMFNPLILWPPAFFELIATSLMFFGLALTTASSFQMLRGSVIIFTALLSLCVFRRKMKIREWIGIFFIVIAMFIIGLSDVMFMDQDTDERNVEGDIMVIIAQLASACQYVYEEVFVVKLDIPPLQCIGWEGVFGFIILTILLFPMQFLPLPLHLHGKNASNSLEDAADAFIQIYNYPLLVLPICLFSVSIAFYNFSGVALSKEINATTRMVLDSVRILIVWGFSLAVSWQDFHYLQLIGFFVFILGMATYNDIYVTKIMDKVFKPKEVNTERTIGSETR